MNIKVVIIWGIVVLVFGMIGVFGLLNQDLLTPIDDEQYIPSDVNDSKSEVKVCSGNLSDASVSYKFNIVDDNIDKITITYNAINGTVDSYQAASNLSNLDVEGFKASIPPGEASNFVLLITVDPKALDNNTLALNKADLDALSIYIDKILKYDLYKQTINASGNIIYNCD